MSKTAQRSAKATRRSASSLEHYQEVSLYETAFKRRREDVAFFLDLAEKVGGPILEFGAGAGRVTLPLARAGHQVTAIDASEPMVERLTGRLNSGPLKLQQAVTVKHGDMRQFKSKARFPLIVATFNVIGHLESFQDMGRFLRCARTHLAPGGTLAFDVPLPHPDELEADPEELFPAPRFKHPDTGAWIRQTERFEYDPGRQLLVVESQYRAEGSEDALTIPLILRQWFPKELEALLHFEGYSHIETFADYSDQPGLFAQDSLVFVAQLGNAARTVRP